MVFDKLLVSFTLNVSNHLDLFKLEQVSVIPTNDKLIYLACGK